MAKKPPPIFEVAKKQDWIDEFTNNPELKQEVSARSADPEFAAAYDYVQRARRAHKGHEPDRKAKAEARRIAASRRERDPSIKPYTLARDIQQILKRDRFGEFEERTVVEWIQDPDG